MKTGYTILLTVLVSLALWASSGEAHAQWDPTRIAEVKGKAESAYDGGKYSEAARHYIELRSMLKSSLDAGEVPTDYVDSARSALIAISYQLGRSNQLSANCTGAETIYRELDAASDVPAPLAVRVQHRLGETMVCRAYEASAPEDVTEEADFQAAHNYLEAAKEVHRGLENTLAAGTLDAGTQGEMESEAVALSMLIEQAETSVPDTMASAIVLAIRSSDCEEAEELLASAQELFPESDWTESNRTVESDCRSPVANKDDGQPRPLPANDPSGPSVVPWIIAGAGGAVLVSAVVLDAVVASDVSEYEDLLDTCKSGVAGRCDDAREMYDDINVKQDVVLALYISGAAITLGGVIWGIIDLTSSSPDSNAPVVGFAPTRGGAMSSVSWRF